MINDVKNIDNFFKAVAGNSAGELSVYFIGIGGIGMSALARYFKCKAVKVSGYDKTPTTLTSELEKEGIRIHFEDDIKMADKNASLIIYTPAIPKENLVYQYYVSNEYPILKRSEVLGKITENAFNVCVAGTHGKTTTSTMVAHILRDTGYGCTAFLGGIATNYGTNFWSSENNVVVVEADEYDRSFLKLNPDVAIITAMDPDHLDIYGNEEAFLSAFVSFSSRLKEDGLLITKEGLKRSSDFIGNKQVTYSRASSTANAFANNISVSNGAYHFDVHINNEIISGVTLYMGGLHNIENSIAAITVAHYLKIDVEKIKSSIASFKGVKRRFEYIIKTDSTVMIDDYAHHPQELETLIISTKKLYPSKKCLIVFQPHLFTRTRDFAEGFSNALGLADEIILLPIYPAREKPIEGITSEMLADLMVNKNVVCTTKNDLLDVVLQKENVELIIMAGAGDIDTLIDPIKEILINKN